MSSTAGEQIAARVLPPRRGACLALTIDATARAYNLQALALGGFAPDAAGSKRAEVYLTLQADGAAVYFHLSPTNDADLSSAAVIAAGGTLAFANTYGAVIEDGASAQFVLDRAQDKYLVVQGGGTLRIYASSESV